jgi:hypothetical protein
MTLRITDDCMTVDGRGGLYVFDDTSDLLMKFKLP